MERLERFLITVAGLIIFFCWCCKWVCQDVYKALRK